MDVTGYQLKNTEVALEKVKGYHAEDKKKLWYHYLRLTRRKELNEMKKELKKENLGADQLEKVQGAPATF